jgi:hypothetical protein
LWRSLQVLSVSWGWSSGTRVPQRVASAQLVG